MTVLMVAGGTGGHILPALALADELMTRGHVVVWVGRPAGMERRTAESRGYRFEAVPAMSFAGRNVMEKLRVPFALGYGVARSVALFSRYQPDLLVAAGGYVSAAPLVAAWMTGRDYCLLEQNRIPGRVNRVFMSSAREAYLAFPLRGEERPNGIVTGSPLRPEIARDGRADDGRTVLVLGGSQGARSLSLAAVELAAAMTDLTFIILTGHRDHELVRSKIDSDRVELVEFTDRPDELYRRATIAISRAGGMVLSELVAFGIPAILVPYPHAADKHQDANAEYIASHGAAITLGQDRLPEIAAAVRSLMDNARRRSEMSDAALRLARPGATKMIAERMEQCLVA